MSAKVAFTIDGKEVQGEQGQTILQAAALAGIYIPHLCAMKGLTPWGSCRVCTVVVNGRPQAACTMPVSDGMVVENDTADLKDLRSNLVEMLFVEGNHYCMFCEKSGNCELQALGYRFGVTAPRYPYQFPVRTVDASHPDVLIDRNRCIMCGRCIRASRLLDHKSVFGAVNRGQRTEIAVNADCLEETDLKVVDKAAELCPVGAILKKRVGFAVPVGKRLFDTKPIGSDIETPKK
jgi:[NiFe] hydrogenase diaphorase moiety small subunit